jgi:methanogenic corrinoid protein MtbC1/DNA-binding XRE family transcriptional regulator
LSTTKTRVTWNSWVASYLQALLAGDERAAIKVVDQLLEKGASVVDFYLKLFTPALERVGELWCAGEISVADERLATEITMTIMDRLRLAMKRPRLLSDRVLVSCIEGERHYVGARMVADLFQMEGWQVDFLGPDVPTPALAAMILQRRPRLVGLSVTLAQNRPPIGDVIDEIARLKAPPVVLLGGQSVSANDCWNSADLIIKVASNALVGLEIARQLLRPEHPRALLEEYLKQLGFMVRQLRNEAGWTQQQLAKATGLTRAYVVGVEGGKQNVTMDVVIRLANALGVAPDRFFEAANEES